MSLRPSSIRLRLTLWYTLALALIVIVFSVSIYFFVKGRLFQQLNEQLDRDYSSIAIEVTEEPADLRNSEPESPTRLFRVVQGKNVYYQSGPYRKAGLPEILDSLASRYQTVRSESGKRFRLATGMTKNDFLLIVAQDEEPIRMTLRTLFVILVLALPSALILAVLGGYVLAARLLRPVAAMAKKAGQISAENLSERLPIENPGDELGKLATILNQTLSRLEDAFERLRRFTADASHELRTPLTAIQSVGEVALQEELDANAYRDRIGSMLEETSRLTHLVESLLLLTRADTGRVLLDRKSHNITKLVEKAVEDMRVMAEEKGQTLTANLPFRIQAVVDEGALRRALVNLLDNAIKYTPEKGSLSVGLKSDDRGLAIEVSDSGPGIPADQRGKIFDRFYRIDNDRSRDIGGAGLGLAIAKWAVEANGGYIELESKEGQGSTFRIVLPR